MMVKRHKVKHLTKKERYTSISSFYISIKEVFSVRALEEYALVVYGGKKCKRGRWKKKNYIFQIKIGEDSNCLKGLSTN